MILRSAILHLAQNARIRRWMSTVPAARRAARRFVAGEELPEAIEVVRALNAQGLRATIDHLGENTRSPEEAIRAAREYLRILDAIDEHRLCANVSLKPTQMGLDVDEELCYANVRRIVQHAKEKGKCVWIDMESSAYTDRTLTLYERLRRAGQDNVGVAIQAYLYRSERDVERLKEQGARIRLCKGAYAEPPDVAFPRKRDVDRNFRRLLEKLWSPEARACGVYVAVATHDPQILAWAQGFIRAHKIPGETFEFQMLYGIRRDLQRRLAEAGYRVRVYVSYGREWYPYFMRRLAERPANLGFLLRHLLRA